MNWDVLTGLLLAAGVLLAAGYVGKELFGDALASFFAEHTARSSDDPNKRLIGAVGEVVEVVDTPGDEMRVRIGIERWRARLAADQGTLPVGTEVKVAAVDGLMLHVEQNDSA